MLNSDIPSFREPFDFESTSESLVSPQSSCFPSENDDDNEVQFYVEEEDITDAVTTEPEDPNADLDREVDEHEDEDKVDEPDSSFEVLKLLLSVLSRVEHEDMGIFKQTNGSRRSTTPSYRALASVMPTIPEDTSIMEAEWEDLEDAEETTETLYDSRPASPPTTNLEAPLPDERFGTVTVYIVPIPVIAPHSQLFQIITSGSGKTSDPHGFRRLRKFFRRAFCGL